MAASNSQQPDETKTDITHLLPDTKGTEKDNAAKGRLTSTSSADYLTEDGLPRSVRKNGRFIIPWPNSKLPSIGGVLKLGFSAKDHSRIPSKQELDRTLPIVTPNHELLVSPPQNGIRVTWMGHSTCLVQMDSISILTDPIFSSRCSPVQFAGPKRFREVPCTIHDLPKLDAVVISHNHYDHLDFNSVQMLNARFGSELRWFVPLGLSTWMHNVGCENVIELDWWDENCIPDNPEIRFVFTPAQHWSKRNPVDDNKVLWGSWCIIGPKNRFFFTGDTGYCCVFEQIGEKYGPFDCSAIPIGAYEPRWFMRMQHVDPCEAVQIHQDIRSKKSLAIHWGTFNLAYEFYLEPPEKLQDTLKEKGISPSEFFTLKHGETAHINDH